MRRQRIDYYHHYPNPVIIRSRRKYGPIMFFFDIFMLFLTNGWWILWILFRLVRKIFRG